MASDIASNVFDDLSDLKKEITFNTTFVPHLNVLAEVLINYDSSEVDPNSLWDQNDWNTELTWDSATGDAISLLNAKFSANELISLHREGVI